MKRFAAVFTIVCFCCTFVFSPECFAKSKKIRFTDGIEAERAFYSQRYVEAESIFSALAKRDNNHAFFCNQLGSVYLAQDKPQKALDAFLTAYYMMNDVDAFSKQETKAISLTGSEADKAYKGDPYEKAFNALHLGLLLYQQGDLQNAKAALRSGILADSDVNGDLYKSDMTLLYALASRLEALDGDTASAEQYLNKAKAAYVSTRENVRPLVSELQEWQDARKEAMDEVAEIEEKYKKKIMKKKKLPRKARKRLAELREDINVYDGRIAQAESRKESVESGINAEPVTKLASTENNLLLAFALGRGPVKFRLGQYGEMAIVTGREYSISDAEIQIDGEAYGFDGNPVDDECTYQAVTRGGRQMDSILKGQAVFKKRTADAARSLTQSSQQMMNQANQFAMAGGGGQAGAAIAAGAAVMSLVAMGMQIASNMANPTADIRHWSLMPAEVVVLPLKVPAGKHKVAVRFKSKEGDYLTDNIHLDINVSEGKDTVVFKYSDIKRRVRIL